MESVIIDGWIKKSSSGGKGYGSGGYADGSGSGDYGSGYGYADGSGSGLGSRNYIRILRYGNQKVYDIDGMPTIVSCIKGNYAKGSTINLYKFNSNECFIARSEDGTLFSHGDTIRRAYDDLQEKISQSLSEEERIEQFCKSFEKGKKYKCEYFYRWHHLLTGSCDFGRKQFLKEHNIDLDDEFTVDEFIEKTIHDYGSEVIQKLKEKWKNI